MQYMGNKHKISKRLLEVIAIDHHNRTWVEPFVGGANMIDKVVGKRIGNDNHPYLIALLKALQGGYVPPVLISKQEYCDIKAEPLLYPPELVGFVGFLCSFGGKWWGGYAHNKKESNYAERGSRLLVLQAAKLSGVQFECGDYTKMVIPDNSLIYCDPPYKATTGYKSKFDHIEFWKWCRLKAQEGHSVYVSEYSAPDDIPCVLEIEHYTVLNKNKHDKKIERLYKISHLTSLSNSDNI